MANEEHLRILRKGIQAWNVWRNESLNIRIDLCSADLTLNSLTGANLANVDLQGANFNAAIVDKANLDRSNLHSANLQRANLRQSHLFGAILDHANLQDADLSWSNLSAASLTNANLTSANLSGANFCNTTLRGANLAYCLVGWTQFDCIDLSSTKGLELVHHREPSIIGLTRFTCQKGRFRRSSYAALEFPSRS